MLIDLRADPGNFTKLTNEELFSIPFDETERIQLGHFRQRFAELRNKLPALQRLSDDVEIERVDSFDDLASLAFPHTMYKSYSSADLEKGRFERLTRWLQSFTTHDLSRIDHSGFESLDDWLDGLEAVTPLRPTVSSGATGKISVWPRSTVEVPNFLQFIMRIRDPYPGQPGLDLRKGDVPFICPWPASTGRHSVPTILGLLRATSYKGHETDVITLGEAHLGAGELWLTGKLRRAEELGEKLELAPRERGLAERMARENRNPQQLWDRFIQRAVVEQRGKKIAWFGFWPQLYHAAKAAIDRGVKIEWAADSVIPIGGGRSGFGLPDNFLEIINEALVNLSYPGPQFRENYAITESTAPVMGCLQRNLHPIPWAINHLVNPDTGESLPRVGKQRGRLLVFDLLAKTHWSGTATGDEVTVHWDGGCACGRKGPYFEDSIRLLAASRGGDDKISCSKTPQAYQKLEEFVAS